MLYSRYFIMHRISSIKLRQPVVYFIVHLIKLMSTPLIYSYMLSRMFSTLVHSITLSCAALDHLLQLVGTQIVGVTWPRSVMIHTVYILIWFYKALLNWVSELCNTWKSKKSIWPFFLPLRNVFGIFPILGVKGVFLDFF